MTKPSQRDKSVLPPITNTLDPDDMMVSLPLNTKSSIKLYSSSGRINVVKFSMKGVSVESSFRQFITFRPQKAI